MACIFVQAAFDIITCPAHSRVRPALHLQGSKELEEVLSERLQQLPPPLNRSGSSPSLHGREPSAWGPPASARGLDDAEVRRGAVDLQRQQ